LVGAEMCIGDSAPADPRRPGAGLSTDALVAGLRRATRRGPAPDPGELLARLAEASGGVGPAPGPGGRRRLWTAVSELWGQSLARHGPRPATRELRRALLSAPDPGTAALLLDLADAHGLRPLRAAELRPLLTGTGTGTGGAGGRRAGGRDDLRDDLRVLRHAGWRHLSGLPDAAPLLPAPAAVEDPYERLLLSAVWYRLAGASHPAAALFTRALPVPRAPRRDGMVVVQPMLQGRLGSPGRGSGGGLGVLLEGLGDALAGCGGVARVLTPVTVGRGDLRPGERLLDRHGEGHWVLRLPTDTDDRVASEEMGDHRADLAWWTTRVLARVGCSPAVVHVRWADDGALAVAEAARRLGLRLVFTATPDPHRRLIERHSGPRDPRDSAGAEAMRHDLHRVFVADRLVARSDAVVAIPGRGGGTEELVRYFPQLEDGHRGRPLIAPPEGIPVPSPRASDRRERRRLVEGLFRRNPGPEALDPAARSLPLLLNVGRLHPVKQQDLLVESWLASGLYRDTALVLIGGDPDRPSPVEVAMRRRITDLLAGVPGAAPRIALVPALPNREVRLLEQGLADPRAGIRAHYVCSSAKEEFGLAILEAMAAGLPAAGPRVGGVPHYIRDGVNGLLLDTSSTASLAAGLARLPALSEPARREMAERGRLTVRRRYSVTGTAERLAREYRSLLAPRAAVPAG
ncbi:glycosyltransferase family 4 protein, partial [Streptomyces calidiresistens]